MTTSAAPSLPVGDSVEDLKCIFETSIVFEPALTRFRLVTSARYVEKYSST